MFLEIFTPSARIERLEYWTCATCDLIPRDFEITESAFFACRFCSVIVVASA
jgi:hypothetical protein